MKCWKVDMTLFKNNKFKKCRSIISENTFNIKSQFLLHFPLQETYQVNNSSFNTVPLDDIKKELQNLDNSKSNQMSDIPTKIIKQILDILPRPLFWCQSNLSQNLELADVKSVYKKQSRKDKTIYRPVSVLPNSLRTSYINK